jgi:hypothetical protein
MDMVGFYLSRGLLRHRVESFIISLVDNCILHSLRTAVSIIPQLRNETKDH